MKFSATFVASIIAVTTDEVAAFGVHSRHAVRSRPSTLRMSLDDLESKVLIEKPIRSTAVKSQPSRNSKKTPTSPSPPAPSREPILVADVAPVKKGKRKVEKYVDLGDVETPKAKTSAPKSAPVPKLERKNPPSPVRKEERPNRIKIPSPPSKPVVAKADDVKNPNAGPLGVALGAAPLLIAPLIALSAARGALVNTAARREKIQEAIAVKERAAKAKAAASVSVDAGGVIGSLGFLGAAFVAVGVALTQSLAGSGLLDSSISIPLPTMPSAPKISFSNPNPIGSRAAVSSPKSTISYLKGYDLDGDSGLTPKQQRVAAKKAAEEKAASAAAEKAAEAAALKKERLERLNEMRSRPTAKVEVAKESSADRIAKVAAEKKAREAAAAEKKSELAKVAEAKAAEAAKKKEEAAKKADVAKAAAAAAKKEEVAKAEAAKKEAAKAEAAKKEEAAKASAVKAAPVEKKVEAPVAAPKPEPTPPAPVIVVEAPAPALKVEPPVPVVAKSAPLPAPVVSIPAPVASAPGALGAVTGGESGGKKLEKETVSAETLEFLKNYQK